MHTYLPDFLETLKSDALGNDKQVSLVQYM